MYISKILAVILLAVVNTCENNNMSDQDSIKILYVDAKLEDCEGIAPQKCLRIKEDIDAEWSLFYDAIEGFDYQEGYVYQIEVRITPVENPLADASSLQYTLIEVVSKEKVTSQFMTVQSQDPLHFVYEAYTRGFSKKIKVFPDYLIKNKNSTIDTVPINEKNWTQLTTLLVHTDPATWNTLASPTKEYSRDAALHTSLSVTFPEHTYQTATFDENNPPEKLNALIQKVRSLANDME